MGLTNFDMGVSLSSMALQPGLDFGDERAPELFEGTAMGEDAFRVLGDYGKRYAALRTGIGDEIPLVRAAARWGSRLRG